MASSIHPTLSPFLHPFKPPNPSRPIFYITDSKRFFHSLTCSSQPSTRPSMDARKPVFKNRRKSSYGTSRRSILKKSFNQEQVTFTTPIPDDPIVGIIGGGMAGIICALALEKRGVRSTIFDTGVHGLGGRMGTRVMDPGQLVFDHAAQFFTVSDSWFAELVDGWVEKGLVRQWKATIGKLEVGGHFSPLAPASPRYVGIKGMRPLADSLLSEACLINVERPCWVSNLEPFNGMWDLYENKKPRGRFDAIVIAHNGKCANRLLATSGLPLLARQMKRLELSSVWALLAAFENPLPISGNMDKPPLEGAFVYGVESVSWMANNTSKLLRTKSSPHCWTFLSTAGYGKKNKVPQESIPTVTAEKVKADMLGGVEAALGLSEGSLPKPFYTRVQLWGAALPTNTPRIPCIFDPLGRAGICGDWLLGSNLESAALSGMALGNHIADYFQSGKSQFKEFAVGLHKEFQPLDGHDIGQFPELISEEQETKTQSYQLTA